MMYILGDNRYAFKGSNDLNLIFYVGGLFDVKTGQPIALSKYRS